MFWQLILEFGENLLVPSSHPLKSHLGKPILENSNWLEKAPGKMSVQVMGETGGDSSLEEEDDAGDKFSLIQIL